MVKRREHWKGRKRNKLKDCEMNQPTPGLGLGYENGNEWTDSKKSINEELTQSDDLSGCERKGRGKSKTSLKF